MSTPEEIPPDKKRHELRKELKLLKLTNMKMKKQLRLSMRVRFLNRTRLENEINELNTILIKLKNTFCNNDNSSLISNENFKNPESLKSNDNKDNVSIKNSNIYAAPVKNDLVYRFFCDRCNFKSRKKGAFDIHLRRHTGERPYICQICKKGFVAKYELKLHQAKHSTDRVYRCNDCDYTTYRPDMLVNHMEKHSSFKIYNCDFCDFKTDDRSKLIVHKKDVHMINLQCLACDKIKKDVGSNTVVEKDVGESVQLQHTCAKPWICSTCGVSFKKKESLKKHTRIHTGEKPYECDRCDYAATVKQTLIVHKRKHSGDKPYACDQCSFRCTTKSYLKIHINTHMGIKPFACGQCDYRSVDSCKLTAHRKVRHCGDKPFACNICPFKAKLRSRLKQHLLIHGPRPFVCRHCAKSFFNKRSLQEHEGTHTGDQPFKCDICREEKRFTLETTYKRHLERHKPRFFCRLCDYKTSLNKDLIRHSEVHANNGYRPKKKMDKSFHCSVCEYQCSDMESFNKHTSLKHQNHQIDDKNVEVNSSISLVVPTQATTSSASYPMNVPLNPLILNIPSAPVSHMDSNLPSIPRDYSVATHQAVDYTTPYFQRIHQSSGFTSENLGNSLDIRNHITPLTSVVFSCDQCDFSISDPHKLSLHRTTHLKQTIVYSDGYIENDINRKYN